MIEVYDVTKAAMCHECRTAHQVTQPKDRGALTGNRKEASFRQVKENHFLCVPSAFSKELFQQQ